MSMYEIMVFECYTLARRGDKNTYLDPGILTGVKLGYKARFVFGGALRLVFMALLSSSFMGIMISYWYY